MSQDEIREKNAYIESTFLGIEDHGITTAVISLSGEGWSQGFGTLCLGTEDKPKAEFGAFVRRVLETLEIDSWESLKGMAVRMRGDYGRVHEIGHSVKDQWFNPVKELYNENT